MYNNVRTKILSFSYDSKHCYLSNHKFNPMFFLLVCPALSKEERELVRRKALKQIRLKYGLQVSLQ